MRKNFKRVAALAAVAAFVTACPLSTSAAGLRDVFDARHYADSYADLKEAFGYDEDALFQHYLMYGLKERRSASTVLDVLKYREAYADLNAAFGDDWDAYVNHYYTFGISENRITGLYDSSLEDTYDEDDEDEDEDDEDDTPEDTPDNKPAEPVPSNPQTPSEPQAPSTEIWAESSTETGIFDYNGKPINVTITYSDVEVYEAEAEPSEGCEWQYYSVTVRTDGTPVDPEALADAISWDQSDVEILRFSHVTHDQQPWYEWFEDRWSYASTLNGVAYDGSVSIEYTHKEDTEVAAYFYVEVPQNSRLTTTVRLNADTVVKHKHAPTPSETQTPGSDSLDQSSTKTGVFDYKGTPVNVTITYSDVEVHEGEEDSDAGIHEGMEWQRYSVTVTTDGTPVDPQVLADAISWDQSTAKDSNCLRLSHDEEPWYEWFADRWGYAISHNGVDYYGYIEIEYTYKSNTEVTAHFNAELPQNFRLTTTVRLNSDTVVKHKHK